jgi:hypothetical protein
MSDAPPSFAKRTEDGMPSRNTVQTAITAISLAAVLCAAACGEEATIGRDRGAAGAGAVVADDLPVTDEPRITGAAGVTVRDLDGHVTCLDLVDEIVWSVATRSDAIPGGASPTGVSSTFNLGGGRGDTVTVTWVDPVHIEWAATIPIQAFLVQGTVTSPDDSARTRLHVYDPPVASGSASPPLRQGTGEHHGTRSVELCYRLPEHGDPPDGGGSSSGSSGKTW